MKKILLTSLCIACCSVFASAQEPEIDLNDVIKTYNETAVAFNNKDFNTALVKAQETLKLAAASTEPRADTTRMNIENLIPRIYYAKALQLANDKKYADALMVLDTTRQAATQYKNDDIKDSADGLVLQVLTASAHELLSDEKYAEAAATYEKIIAITPNDSEAHFRLGQAQMKLGNETAAITTLQKAKELGSEDAGKQLAILYLNKAITANSAKKWNDVMANAEKALTYDAENATATRLLGNAAVQVKKWDIAIENLEKVVPADVSNNQAANIINNLAMSYEAKGNKAKACEYYKKITGNATFKAFAGAKVKELCK